MILSLNRRTLVCVGLLLTSRAVAQQPVKVDDGSVYGIGNPNGIQFSSSGWSTVNPQDVDLRYDSTYTWSQTAGANLIFFFRGTAISHYADKGPHRGPVGVSIDGKPYTNVTWTNVNASTMQYQQQMWSIRGLSLGDHQVVISNVGTGDPAESIMGVDYLEVTSGSDGSIKPVKYGPGASGIPSNAMTVDDSSDSISYSGSSWDVYTSSNNIGVYLGGGQHSSTSPGAVITFKFNGTAVWYFCDQYENNTIVSISLDGGAGETVNTASPVGIWLTQYLTWGKADLVDGPHTLTITHAGSEGTYANVDFFKYMPSVNSPPATTSASSIPSTSSSVVTSSSESTPIGAIVGGVVGGITIIALIAGFLVWRWRRRPTQNTTAPGQEAYVGDASYIGKEAYAHPSAYAQNLSGTPSFAPTMDYQHAGMHPAAQNLGTAHSITPTTWTGATYAGHPEI